MTRGWRLALIAVPLAASVATVAAQPTEPSEVATFTLADPVGTVDPGSTMATVRFRLNNLAGLLGDIEVEDGEAADVEPHAKVTKVRPRLAEKGRSWDITLQLTGPREADLNRALKITLGGKNYVKDYRIAVRSGGAVTYSTLQPALWRDGAKPRIPVIISVSASGTSDLKVVTKGLATTDGPLAITGFSLTPNEKDGATASGYLAGPRAYQFYIQPTTDMPGAGHYTGDVAVVSAKSETPQFQSLVITVSSLAARVWGWALLAIGVLMGLLLTQSLRQRANHLGALRPAGIVVSRVQATQAYLKMLDKDSGNDNLRWPKLSDALRAVLAELSDAKLAAFGVTRSWWKLLANPVIKSEELTAYVTPLSVRAGLLDMLARNGMGKASNDVAVWKALDALSYDATITNETEMRGKISDALAPNANPANVDAGPPVPWTIDRIDMELVQLNLGVLVFTSVVTIVTGGIVLIESVPAFGSTRDLLLCVLWGLGFTGGAAALPNLTVESIRAQIGLPRPT